MSSKPFATALPITVALLLAPGIDGLAWAAKPLCTITVSERGNVDREKLPLEVELPERLRDVVRGELALFRQLDGAKTVQVACDVVPAAATTGDAPRATRPAAPRLIFLVDLPAGGTAKYELRAEAPKPAAKERAWDTAADRMIDVGPVEFRLHKPSGQLLSFVPRWVCDDRLVFLQNKQWGEFPIHWNPDVWAVSVPWTHTHKWNAAIAASERDTPAAGEGTHPYFYRASSESQVYRLARWGKMPLLSHVDAAVTYTFFAGLPVVLVDSSMTFNRSLAVRAVRNGELVFSRHQFDTAVWQTHDGKFHAVSCYDYEDKDKSFKMLAKVPANVRLVGFANERKGFGIAYVPLTMTNRHAANPVDEPPHFTLRDYDEHGRGNPYNFHYFVRYLVVRDGFRPTTVAAGDSFSETSAVVVFKLNSDAVSKYDELIRWQQMLAGELEVRLE